MQSLIIKNTLITLCIIFFSMPAASVPKSNVDISIGAAAWYAWWSPMFEKKIFNAIRYGSINNIPVKVKNHFTISPSYLAGPMFSVGFLNKWSFSTVFVCGNLYKARSSLIYFYPQTMIVSTPTDTMSIIKYDLDSTLNYSIIRYIKIFAGVKYQGYHYTGSGPDVSYVISNGIQYKKNKYDIKSNGYGPGIGIGLTVPLIKNLYLLFNVSGLYLDWRIKGTQYWQEIDVPPFSYFYSKIESDMHFNIYGFNTNLSFACYIASASTTISLGCRYQYLNYRIKKVNAKVVPYPLEYIAETVESISIANKLTRRDYDNTTDMFYGLTLSAVYSFEIK